jgi:hypothetical protein
MPAAIAPGQRLSRPNASDAAIIRLLSATVRAAKAIHSPDISLIREIHG